MASKNKEASSSINLQDTEIDDNNDVDNEDKEEENELKDLREESRISTAWKEGGALKDVCV